MRCALGACLAVGAMFGILPASAAAADATIDFESLAPETTVTNQFADVGGPGQGVVFGPLPGAGGNGFRPVVKTAPGGLAHSGSQVADVSLCNNGNCGGAEFYAPGTTGTFQSPRQKVSVRVGLDGPPVGGCGGDQSFCSNVTLTAFNANGNPIGTPSSATVQRGAGFHTLLSVEVPTASIRGFQIRGQDSADNNEAVRIDDLTFDVPTTPPPPDFTVTPSSTFLVMSQGQTIRTPLAIGRTGGSAGNIGFELSGPLPDGVDAIFQPNPAGGGNSDLVLVASPDSEFTGFDPIALTVTATPLSPTAGSEPRTFPISLQVRSAFDVSLPGPNTGNLDGCVARIPIQVRRDFGFPGPVSLAVDGLANGVQASFEPAGITFPNGAGAETTNLVVTAPETGQRVPATTLTVRAGAPGFADRTAQVTVSGTCPYQYDARVTSLEVTQGVQSPVLPHRYTDNPASPIGYDEIPSAARLQRHKQTVVRAYANLLFGPPEGVKNVPVVLHGSYRDSIGNLKALPGSPITAMSGFRDLSTGPEFPPDSEQQSETAVYSFQLPESWTEGRVRLTARVIPSIGGSARAVRPCESPACVENDGMGLTGVPFEGTRSVTVNPLEFEVSGAGQPTPESVFRWVRMTTPLDISFRPYAATYDVTDEFNELTACRTAAPPGDPGRPARLACSDAANSAVAQFAKDYTCDNSITDRKWNVGINTGVARGLQSDIFCYGQLSSASTAVVERMRPLTSVGHEFGHLLGLPHADLLCGGNSGGQSGEAWPPDDQGFLQSVGLATENGTGVSGGPFAVMTPPKQWFDYMSYCANSDSTTNPAQGTADAWISLRNWNRIFEAFDYDSREEQRSERSAEAPERQYRKPRGAAVDSLHVTGFASGDTGSITAVAPESAPPQPPSDSAYRLVGVDGAGQVVADVAMIATPFHADDQPPGLSLDAVIPRAGVATVAIVRDGTVLDARAQSASAPTVALRGKPRFRKGNAELRWRSGDADGDALLASVEYSADDGDTFEQIWAGPSAGAATVPAHYLSRSGDARLRVTVNDGFREASVSSKRFASPGAPPDATIIAPANGTRQPNDAPLSLSGQAFDDASNAIRGKDLTWFSGKRRLGSGERIAPAGLRPGRHRIELVARDRTGRVGRDAITVRLAPTPPVFLELAAPDSVKKKARSLGLRVASSLEAKLKVSGAGGKAQTFSVGRRASRVAVRIPRGSRELDLRLELKAGKRASTRLLSVDRG